MVASSHRDRHRRIAAACQSFSSQPDAEDSNPSRNNATRYGRTYDEFCDRCWILSRGLISARALSNSSWLPWDALCRPHARGWGARRNHSKSGWRTNAYNAPRLRSKLAARAHARKKSPFLTRTLESEFSMNCKSLCRTVGATIVCVLCIAWSRMTFGEVTFVKSTDNDQLEIIRMSVTPAAEPVPALKFRLMARDIELEPGNAAPYYYRAFLQF